MKKITIYAIMVFAATMFLGTLDSAAQHYIGIRGGIGSGSARFYPKVDMGTVWGLYSGGISWKYYSKEPVLGGIEVDLLFMQQGYKELYMSIPTNEWEKAEQYGYYQRTVNCVMMPIAWQPHVYMFRRKMRVFLNLAVTFSYNISSREKSVDDENAENNYERKYTMKLTRDNPFGYGLFGGGGVGWSFGKFEVLAEARYYFGLGDILRNRNKYEDNPLRSPLDGLQIQAGFYYRLGKKGILSPPSRKLQKKLQMEEDAKSSSTASK